MLMGTEETRTTLGPIARALDKKKSRALLDDIDRRAAQIVAKIVASHGFAEVVPGVVPQWYLALTLPGKERIAADELRDRGFGIYLPEDEIVEIRRGRKVNLSVLLLPGYVLFFGWSIDSQLDRVRACEGVRDVFLRDGRAFIVPESMVDKMRSVENEMRPVLLVSDVPDAHAGKKARRRWRKSRNAEKKANDDCEIIGVHAYSPMIEEARQAMLKDRAEELRTAFHRMLGL